MSGGGSPRGIAAAAAGVGATRVGWAGLFGITIGAALLGIGDPPLAGRP